MFYSRSWTISYAHCPFFLRRCADHPDLHSFPTRRSSDLSQGWTTGNDPASERVAGAWFRDAYLKQLAGALADRKSTRLNSSHANISYAVFCLKKKKKLKRRK